MIERNISVCFIVIATEMGSRVSQKWINYIQ